MSLCHINFRYKYIKKKRKKKVGYLIFKFSSKKCYILIEIYDELFNILF